MFKTKLQELCQKRRWEMPDYVTQKEGLSHNPRFMTTLTVNGLTFNNQSEFRSLKLSQNEAAKLALLHFNSSPSSSSPSQQSQPPPSPQQQQHRTLTPPLPLPPPALDTVSSFPQPSFSQPTQQPLRLSLSSDPSSETVVGDDMQTERRKSQAMAEKCPLFPPNKVLTTVKSDTAFGVPKIIRGPSSESMVDENVQAEITKFQAKIAEMFPPVLPNVLTSVKDDTAFGDMQHLYKNQLQQYAQKRGLSLPVYSCDCEGPPHASRFKCRVTVGGKTYESAEFYSTIKSAEHASAMIALMSLSPDGAQEDDTGIYKNLLQELVQKKGLALPIYNTTRSGQPHIPIFVSSLEVGGQVFTGQEAKTKKQAEMNVAKIAYFALKDGEGKNNPSSLVHSPNPQSISSRLQSNVMGMKHQTDLGIPINYSSTAKSENQAEGDEIRGSSKATCHQSALLPTVSVAAPGDQSFSSSCNLNGYSSSASNYPSPCYDNGSLVKNSSGSSSVPTADRKVVVVSRKTNVEIQDGLTLLSFSDENWAAYSNWKQ